MAGNLPHISSGFLNFRRQNIIHLDEGLAQKKNAKFRRVFPCGEPGSQRHRHCQMFKLTLLSVLPGLILIARNAVNLAESSQILQENQAIIEDVFFSLEVGSVIHQTQIERGTTALYVSSGGDPFLVPRLQALYQLTDSSILSLSKWIPLNHDHFQSRDQYHEAIRQFRSNLDPQNATLTDVIGFYTRDNKVFIEMIGKSINVEKSVSYWTSLVAYQMLIMSKEQAGIERALGSTYFARGQFPLKDLLWYKEKKTLGTSYLEQCLKYSSFVKALIDEKYSESSLAQNIDSMRETIIANNYIEPSVMNGAVWFDNMTSYIEILKDVQDSLGKRIIDETQASSNFLEQDLTLHILELIIALVLVPIIAILVRNVTNKIQEFSAGLQKKTAELEQERKRTENLLFQLLPQTVAKKLMSSGHVLPEAFHSVTVMFTDVVGFTAICSRSTPMQVVAMLNKLYLTFDEKIEDYDVYKLETIGDGYMVASGLPVRNGDKHVSEIALLALDLRDTMAELEIPHLNNEKFRLRIGFNTGPVVAGVVGIKMPRYCIFGDTVNTASRMESTGIPLKIQFTEMSHEALIKHTGFIIRERGKVAVKGKGDMTTFWLEGYDVEHSETPANISYVNFVNVCEVSS